MPINGITPKYIEDIKSRDDIGVPGEIPYLPNDDEQFSTDETGDTSGVNSSSSTSQTGSTTTMSGDYDSGYIENSDEYNSAVDHATGSLDNSEATVDEMFAGINDSDYTSDAGNGYQSVNGEKLANLLIFLNLLTNAQLAMKMVLDSQDELSSKLRDILFELQPEEGADEATAAAKEKMFKNAKEKLKIVQQFISSLYKKIYNHNMQVYQQRMKELEEEKEDRAWYDDVGNYFSGGQQDIDNEKAKLEATQQYSAALSANLTALQYALQTMAIVFEQMNTPEGRAIGKSLRELNQRVSDANAGMIAGGYEDYYDADNMGNLFQDILSEIRDRMVQAENIYRAIAYLQSAQQELSDSVRESVLEISPHSSKLQYRMIASEGVFNMANMFFDNAYNTLMMKVKAHNSEVQISKNIEKLKAAQGWKIASIGLQVVAVVLAVVASVFSFGALAAPATIAVISLCSALAGLGAAGLNSIGSAIAAGVDDNYDVNDPTFSKAGGVDLQKRRSVTDVIDDAERAENEVISGMGSGLIETTQDGYCNLNSRALSAMEVRQQSIQNLVKMIVYLKKAQRDLNRAILGIVLEKAIKDHGEGYLINNLENSLHQRQLMTQAIKFQLQEKVTAKNIARQNEIMASKAFWSSTSGVIGAGLGALCAAIPGAGGLAVVPALMGIGSAIGSSLYNYIESHSEASGYGMKYESHSQEFDRLMTERRKAAQQSQIAEDKLYQLENAAIEELMANGLVGTGDGYSGVNYTLVGKAYQQMLNIQNIRQFLVEIRNAMIRQSASTRRQVLGISTSETTDLGNIVAQRGLTQAMAIVASVTRMLSDKAAVQNRARDAQKAANMATFSFATNVVVAAAGMGAGYSPGVVGETAAAVSRNITPGLMGLVNGTASLIMNAIWATDDYGAYNNYSSDKAVKEIRGNRRQKTEQDNFDKLAALENQVFQEMGENLVQTLQGGTGAVNGEITGILNSRMHALNNLRKSLLILLSARDSFSQAIRRKVGVGGGPIADQTDLASPQERVTQAILGALTQGVQTLVERQNQISQAERQMFVSSFSVVMSAVSVALGAVAATKATEADTLSKDYENTATRQESNLQTAKPAAASTTAATNQPVTPPTPAPAAPAGDANKPPVTPTPAPANQPVSPNQPAPPTAGATTTPSAQAAVPGQEPKVAPNPDGVDSSAKKGRLTELRGKIDDVQSSYRAYSIASASISLVNTFWSFYGGEVWDKGQEEKKSSHSESKLDAVRDGKTAKKSSALSGESSTASSEGSGIYETTGANEAEALDSEVMISSYSTPTAAAISLQRAEQMVNTWMDGVNRSGSLLASTAKPKNPWTISANEKTEAAVPAGLVPHANLNTDLNATYKFVKESDDPVKFVREAVDQKRVTPENGVKLLERLAAERPELKPQIDPVRASLAAAVSQPAPVQQTNPVRPQFSTDRPAVNASRAHLQRADEISKNINIKMADAAKQEQSIAQANAKIQAHVATKGSQEPATYQQVLEQLVRDRDDLVKKYSQTVDEIKKLSDEVKVLKTQRGALLSSLEAEKAAVLAQNPNDPNVKPTLDMIEGVKGQLNEQLDRQVKEAEQKVVAAKAKLVEIKGQCSQINQQIAMVQRELAKERELAKKEEIKAKEDQEKVRSAGNREAVAKAGNLGHSGGNGNGEGSKGGNGYKSKADQLQEEQDRVLASYRGNGSSTMGGVS
ncbi:MAG: hypothetical protein WCW67_02935 [Candidatus Margulisiibacteriota bacterium]|jgi:hypothetical protein